MTPNFVHMHLLLNHVPTVGTIVALGILLLGFAKRSEELTRGALALFFTIALVSLPTYMTGYSAQKAIKERPGVSAELIQRHQSAALVALTVIEATGVLAWFGLWQGRKPSQVSRWNAPVVLLLATVSLRLMASASNIGRQQHTPHHTGPPRGSTNPVMPPALPT